MVLSTYYLTFRILILTSHTDTTGNTEILSRFALDLSASIGLVDVKLLKC